MRILLVSALFPTPAQPRIVGGAEVVARRLADALAADGHELVVLRAAPPGMAWPEETIDGICVVSLPIRRPYWPFDGEHGGLAKLAWHARDDRGESADAARLIRAIAPDLVHTHNIGGLSTGLWRAAARAGVPIVHTLHDYYLLCPRTSRFRDGARCGAICTDCRLLTLRRRADTRLVGDVVGVSDAVLGEQVAHGLFAQARRHVVPNIIQPALAADPKPATTPVAFGFLGRITVEKGVERLVEAFGRMAAPARLLFGGRIDETMRARLIDLARGRPLEFLGFVAPADFFREIDVLAVPSIWSDPLPTVILEAQTAGVPAIGSRRGGIAEAIGSDAAGWTYDPDDPDALTALLDRVAADPAAIAAKAHAARAASQRFTAEAVLARYRAVYAAALGYDGVDAAAAAQARAPLGDPNMSKGLV